MKVLETERLILRWLNANDAAFILRLVNEPSWLQYIGDRGIKTLDAAKHYIENGPLEMCQRLGFGLWLVELKDTAQPVGICGLIKRDALPDVDVGFALLPEYWGKGYAFESAAAAMAWGRKTMGLSRFAAVASPHNVPSGKLLEKLGFRFERLIRLREDAEKVRLYLATE